MKYRKIKTPTESIIDYKEERNYKIQKLEQFEMKCDSINQINSQRKNNSLNEVSIINMYKNNSTDGDCKYSNESNCKHRKQRNNSIQNKLSSISKESPRNNIFEDLAYFNTFDNAFNENESSAGDFE
jgi:hypothetical protein